MSLKKLVNAIEYIRNSMGLDCPIAITGPEQIGKSTLGIQLLKRMFYDGDSIREFLEKHIAYTNQEIETKLMSMEKGSGIQGDETIRWAYRRNWGKDVNKQAVMLWRQIGFKRLVAFLNLPVFWELDNAYRNGRVKLWIHVFAKGHAVVFQPDVNAFSPDPWYQRETSKIMSFTSQFDAWERQLVQYRKCKIYFDHVQFDKLKGDWITEYEAISHERKMDKDNMDKVDKYKKRILRAAPILNERFGLNQREIGEVFGYTKQNISKMMGKLSNDKTDDYSYNQESKIL